MGKKMKILSLVTACTIVASLFAGCSGKKQGETGEGTQTTQATQTDKPLELTWTNYYAPAENSPVQQYLEKKYNVKIKILGIDRSQYEQILNLKIASGEKPDICVNVPNWTNLVESGLFASFTKDELKKYLPNYLGDIEKIDSGLWNGCFYKGKYWGVPGFYYDGATGFLPAYNGDMLKAAGFSEAPKTLDELEKFFVKVHEANKSTYGISGMVKGNWAMSFMSIFGAYQVIPNFWNTDKNGKVVYGMTTENARQAFKLLNKWYKMGLIDPEYITEDGTINRQKFASGRVAMLDTGMYYHLTLPSGNIAADFKAKNPNTEIVVGKPLAGPNGAGVSMAWGGPTLPTLINSRFQNDENLKKKLFAMIDGIASDEETWLEVTYGEKGVHYDMVNGLPVPKAEYAVGQNRSEKVGAGGFFTGWTGAKMWDKYGRSPAETENKKKFCTGVPLIVNEAGTMALETAKQYPDIVQSNIQKEYFVKFISGEVDLDKGFDAFVEKFNSSGGKQMGDEVNKLYAERKNAK